MEERVNDMFWNAAIKEVKTGFVEGDKEFRCIVCGEVFAKGRIYEVDGMLYDAAKAAELHVESQHGSMLKYLLGMNSAFTGLSEVQRDLLTLIAQGMSDKEAAERLGVAQSTIRNHRYKLREREKQARLFIALMELLANETDRKIHKLETEVICDAHKTATTLDDRYNITDKEKASTLKTYMNEHGGLTNYPVKEKKKIIVLEEIAKNFSPGKTYSEKEINRMLKRIYGDYATIRRALIEYGFLDRTNDGGSYWVKE